MEMLRRLLWEDVNTDDEIPHLIKVASLQDLVKWAGAFGDWNPHHFDDVFANEFMKTNGAVIHGPLKRAWLAQMLTEWIGYDGRLTHMSTSYRSMDYPRHMKDFVNPHEGEIWRCCGKVTGKRTEGADRLVDCEIWLENGKGEKTTFGTAVVSLPARHAV